jgi:hypothetical protein
MSRLRTLTFAALALALSALALTCAMARASYTPEPWLEDLDALEAHMGVVYANLEWNVEHRGLDLAELDGRTRAAIRAAGSDGDAASAIEDFVAAFRDPHFSIESHRPPWIAWAFRLFEASSEDEEPVTLPAAAQGGDACGALGYREDGHGFEFPVDRLPGWEDLPEDEAFPGGTFSLPDGRRVGLLRIAQFGENRYGSACAEIWDAAPPAGPCDEECLEAFRGRASDALAVRVTDRVRAFESAGIDALVVDVTGNGGGSEWVDPVTRIFSAKPLRSMRASMIRHPRSIDYNEERLAEVEAALAAPGLPDATRARLSEAAERLAAVLAELRAPCDRASLWRGRAAGCSQLVETPTYATGIFDWLPEGALEGVADSIAADLYSPRGREVPAGVWDGPLFVLADHGSASATEAFVAMLKDNGAATVIGERTYGAGCGFLDGGLPLELPNSGLEVWMPDCARFRIDGTNEIEGIEPDVPVEWSELGGEDRVLALVAALGAPRDSSVTSPRRRAFLPRRGHPPVVSVSSFAR